MAADALVYLYGPVDLAAAATTTGTALSLTAGTPNNGFVFRVLVTAIGGTSPTITVNLQDSTDAGTTYLTRTTVKGNLDTANTITAVGEYFVRYYAPAKTVLLRPQIVVGGTSPTCSISIAQVATNP